MTITTGGSLTPQGIHFKEAVRGRKNRNLLIKLVPLFPRDILRVLKEFLV
jgi:hypothetical protein